MQYHQPRSHAHLITCSDDAPRKRRKLNDEPQATLAEWDQFERDVSTFNVQHILGKSKLAFSFVEGPLLRALRAGDWCVSAGML